MGAPRLQAEGLVKVRDGVDFRERNVKTRREPFQGVPRQPTQSRLQVEEYLDEGVFTIAVFRHDFIDDLEMVGDVEDGLRRQRL